MSAHTYILSPLFMQANTGMEAILGKENAIKTDTQRRNYIFITISVFAAFIVYGFAETVKGTALPRIQADFDITELQLGLLLAVNSIGYLIACSFTAVLAKKIGIRTCMIAALCIIAVSGVCICFSPSYAVLMLAFFVLYLGNGMLEVSSNIIAATIFTKNTGAMMNLAHFFYGLGAIFSPVMSAGLMAARLGDRVLGWRYMYLIVLGCALIPAIPALIGRMKKQNQNVKKTGFRTILKNPTLWLTVLILALGSISELGVSAWLVNFLEKAYSFSGEKAALQLTLFFICFTLSRLVFGPIIDRIGFINTLMVFMAFAGIMITLGVLCGEKATPLLIIAGIGVAPLYPTVMAVISKLFAEVIDLAMTAVTTIMGVFMIFVNFLLGGIVFLSRLIFTKIYGDAGVGMAYAAGCFFLGLCCFGAAAFAVILRKRQKKAGQLV